MTSGRGCDASAPCTSALECREQLLQGLVVQTPFPCMHQQFDPLLGEFLFGRVR